MKRTHLQVQSKHRPLGQYRPRTRGCPTQPGSCIRHCIIIVPCLCILGDLHRDPNDKTKIPCIIGRIITNMVHQQTKTETREAALFRRNFELFDGNLILVLSPGQTDRSAATAHLVASSLNSFLGPSLTPSPFPQTSQTSQTSCISLKPLQQQQLQPPLLQHSLCPSSLSPPLASLPRCCCHRPLCPTKQASKQPASARGLFPPPTHPMTESHNTAIQSFNHTAAARSKMTATSSAEKRPRLNLVSRLQDDGITAVGRFFPAPTFIWKPQHQEYKFQSHRHVWHTANTMAPAEN